MTTFADRAKDRNNHFNLIRFIAAFVVLAAHSAIFVGVWPFWDPYAHGYDLATGGMAVDAFFVISGFLVTGSLLSRQSLSTFVWARFLRIFPGLWVMLLLTVFGLGLALTTLPAREFLASPITHEYLWRCATLVNGIRKYLPGVFETNRLDTAFNGSLWTLPIEWRMYEFLAIAWVLLAIIPKYRLIAFRLLAPIAAVAGLIYVGIDVLTHERANLGSMHSYMFFAGSAILVLGDKIPVSFKIVPILLAVLAVSLLHYKLALLVYLVVMPFLVLNLAYAPGRLLLRFNRFGDYSYGVYIYAYPIQQTVHSFWPDLSPGGLTALASAPTLVMAMLSWRFVEKPALAHREAFASATRGLIDRLRRQPALETAKDDGPGVFAQERSHLREARQTGPGRAQNV
jgi:peptidoglycan/LPS O-acetylase OafA/YrhL